MGIRSDYIGQKFNYLTVLSHFKKGSLWYFRCRCDCGREKDIYRNVVLKGITKTCGARECIDKLGYHTSSRIDLTGRKFGRLKVIKLLGVVHKKTPSGHRVSRLTWLCQCSCGNKHITTSRDLLCKKTVSCGCYTRERTSKMAKDSPLQKS